MWPRELEQSSLCASRQPHVTCKRLWDSVCASATSTPHGFIQLCCFGVPTIFLVFLARNVQGSARDSQPALTWVLLSGAPTQGLF